MSPEEKLLTGIIKGKTKENLCKNINWNKFTELCFYHRINSFVYSKLEKIAPEKTLEEFREKNRQTTIQNMVLEKEAKELFNEFERKKIEYIAFKGIALNHWIYSKNYLRQSSDIDVLIKEKEYEKAVKACSEKGFKAHAFNAWKKIPFRKKIFNAFYSNLQHFPLMEKTKKTRIVIELHKQLFFPLNSFTINYTEIRGDSVEVNGMKMPGKEDSIIISVLSAVYQHAFYGIFEALIDVQNIIKLKPDFNKLKGKTIKYNAIEAMAYFNELTKEFFGTEIKGLNEIQPDKNKMNKLRKNTESFVKKKSENAFFYDLKKTRIRLIFAENLKQKIQIIFFALIVSWAWKTTSSLFRKE